MVYARLALTSKRTFTRRKRIMNSEAGVKIIAIVLIAASCVAPGTTMALDPDTCVSFVDSGQSLSTGDTFVVALGDLDGDGDLDAFIIGGQNPATVWYNDGDGMLSNSGQSLGLGLNHGVSLGDLDGDGDLDAYVVNNDQPNMVYYNDSSGVFTDSGQRLGLGSDYGNFVWLADLDGDDDLDAAVHNYIHENEVWYNDGEGVFDSSWAFGGNNSGSMGLGDLDGDEDIDVFMSNGSDPLEVWLNNGSGRFLDSGQRLGAGGGWRHVGLGDLDGDDDLDAFVTNNDYGNQVWFNDGAGVFGSPSAFFGDFTQKVALADVDGDGDLDACTTHMDNGNYVWMNSGTGAFTSAGKLLGDGPNLCVSLGDIDSDGDPDAAIGGSVFSGNEPTRLFINESYQSGVPGRRRPSGGVELHPSSPNPVSMTTRITYYIQSPCRVRLEIYDIEGRAVRTLADGLHDPGRQSAEFDATGLASGIYFCRLVTEDGSALSQKMLVLR